MSLLGAARSSNPLSVSPSRIEAVGADRHSHGCWLLQ